MRHLKSLYQIITNLSRGDLWTLANSFVSTNTVTTFLYGIFSIYQKIWYDNLTDIYLKQEAPLWGCDFAYKNQLLYCVDDKITQQLTSAARLYAEESQNPVLENYFFSFFLLANTIGLIIGIQKIMGFNRRFYGGSKNIPDSFDNVTELKKKFERLKKAHNFLRDKVELKEQPKDAALLDPKTQKLMKIGILLPDGYVYDYETALEVLEGNRVSPMTGEALKRIGIFDQALFSDLSAVWNGKPVPTQEWQEITSEMLVSDTSYLQRMTQSFMRIIRRHLDVRTLVDLSELHGNAFNLALLFGGIWSLIYLPYCVMEKRKIQVQLAYFMMHAIEFGCSLLEGGKLVCSDDQGEQALTHAAIDPRFSLKNYSDFFVSYWQEKNSLFMLTVIMSLMALRKISNFLKDIIEHRRALATGEKAPIPSPKDRIITIVGEKGYRVPSRLFCPITRDLLRKPVTDSKEGITYEQEAIDLILRAQGKSPMTGKPYGTHIFFLPNISRQLEIEEFRQRVEKEKKAEENRRSSSSIIKKDQ